MSGDKNERTADRRREEEELETYTVHVCQSCGAELPIMAECYPTVCAACGGTKFYQIEPKPNKPDKAAFLPGTGIIDDYTN
ncbi:hypothetical protein SD70_06010 [Gordoniibacillus kamchatkensis]|uniref:Uncharacterized protein n=1 Tax=Gordoniibacillus kamchatkensis TaxID=1590651 RepID=A0ABR5AMT7_9BACL|nr:hypothetical protein [Paenibacillus sp. VKM B-2647]KIL41667.1 hypothetical protein SD70_06010 [Paenibacillus sp. VKM B-2647]